MDSSEALAIHTSIALRATDASAAITVTTVIRTIEGVLRMTVTSDESLITDLRGFARLSAPGLLGSSAHLQLLNLTLPRFEHSLVFGSNGWTLTCSPEPETGMKDLPPHIDGEDCEQRPFKYVGPTESVARFSATEFEPKGGHAAREAEDQREVRLERGRARKRARSGFDSRLFIRHRLGVTHVPNVLGLLALAGGAAMSNALFDEGRHERTIWYE